MADLTGYLYVVSISDIHYVLDGLPDHEAIQVGELLLPECTEEEILGLASGELLLVELGAGRVSLVRSA